MAKPDDEYQGNDPRYPSQQQDRFIVRLPDGMRERIKAEADKNNRSMNAEIVARLAQTFDEGPTQLIEGLQRQVAGATVRANAFLEVVKMLSSIVADASGGDPATMASIAAAIRSLKSGDDLESHQATESESDKIKAAATIARARANAADRLAKTIAKSHKEPKIGRND